ncbi:hypothetical protein CQW23_20747 [Capsicum baccatum]|uniref:F-box domain-containing protein n=1 Tax=Capsicum baccatum TaxID=33114 RepID=A0A2G2W9H8_CAPBA|nr:hypothetical protein CQW23_20747 [Capsicum baccatum]
MSRCEAVATTIGGLPNDILGRLLEKMPIQDAAKTSILSKKWIQIWSTLLLFDHLFFQYVSDIGASASSIIHKILMQHTGNILGFHLISSTCELAQSDVDQCIISVSQHGIQKLTHENYFDTFEALKVHRESEDTLDLPVLEILELRFCTDVDSVNLVSPNLDKARVGSCARQASPATKTAEPSTL